VAQDGSGAGAGHRLLVLSTKRAGSIVVVGGVIVVPDSEREFAVDADLLEPIASALLGHTVVPTSGCASI